MNTASRILVVIVCVLGLGLGILAHEQTEATKRHYREAVEEPLVDTARILARLVTFDPAANALSYDALERALMGLSTDQFTAQIYDLNKSKVDIQVYVTDSAGIVRFDSRQPPDIGADYSKWNDVHQTLRGRYGARSSPNERNVSTLYVAAPIRDGDAIKGVLTVAKPTDNSSLFIKAARRSSRILAFAIFASVAFLGLVLGVIVTRPIRRLTNYVGAVRDGKRTTLPALSGSDFKLLGKSFEEMREALEGKKYVEKYIHALTHEIKSPLAGIQAAAELLQGQLEGDDRVKLTGNIERETVRLRLLADKLLSLSSLQAAQKPIASDEFFIHEVLEEISSSFEATATKRNLRMTIDCDRTLKVQGDKFWITEAVRNIVQNAVEFSPPNSSIEISAKASNDIALITVADRGPGVPDWAKEKIFDQFFSLPRPDTHQKSSGLGLAIVKEVMEQHEGTITVKDREDSGTVATLRLPLK